MIKTLISIGFFIFCSTEPPHILPVTHIQENAPSYAKWGKMAVEETQKKYPHASILDYLHEGSETKEELTIEKFKLWLKEGNKEFGVFIRITYHTNTQQFVQIEFQETSR